MSKHADGGPAFPTPWAAGTATEGGMTLRDWFAGQAMVGILSVAGPYGLAPYEISERSYRLADAMIKERKK